MSERSLALPFLSVIQLQPSSTRGDLLLGGGEGGRGVVSASAGGGELFDGDHFHSDVDVWFPPSLLPSCGLRCRSRYSGIGCSFPLLISLVRMIMVEVLSYVPLVQAAQAVEFRTHHHHHVADCRDIELWTGSCELMFDARVHCA